MRLQTCDPSYFKENFLFDKLFASRNGNTEETQFEHRWYRHCSNILTGTRAQIYYPGNLLDEVNQHMEQQKHICLPTKLRLYRALVKTIVLYGCETWTLLATTESKLKAFENKCRRKILQISYLEHKTNAYVWDLFWAVNKPL